MTDEDLSICVVLETHIKEKQILRICDFVYGRWMWISNMKDSKRGCRIIVGWNPDDVNIMEIHSSSQAILCMIETVDTKDRFYCCFTDAASFGSDRRLWKDLNVYKGNINNKPWVLMGDWNVSLNLEDHSEGGSIMTYDMNDFRECIDQIEVEDVNCSGLHFTWVQSRLSPTSGILKKRVMSNVGLIDKFPSSHAIFLPHLTSDHSPAVLVIPKLKSKRHKAFRFANFIADKPEFLETVEKEWDVQFKGCKMYQLVKKQKVMKYYMKKLTWKNGNIYDRVVESREKEVDKDPHNADLKNKEAMILNEFNCGAQDEEKLLYQQAKVNWLSEGDKNSKYFHTVIKGRKNRSRIDRVCNENGESFEGKKKVSNEDAEFMTRQVSDDEIKHAMFDICDNKAPGPDGYTAKFYKKAWSKIGRDVCDAVKEFFASGRMLGPIACCNVIYKTISKILTNRIKSALSKLVNPNQSAFIPGRLITDNILITQELLKGYNWKNGAKRIAMKIDIHKAYDTIDESNKFKYHWGCKQLKISHLCFADDLLVLCHGDLESVGVIKRAITGLNPNMGKSTVFFGNVAEQVKQQILQILPFKVGKLPVTYLGVPLITKQISANDCKCLIDKINARVNNWKNRMLSYAGRLQLIASVLASMHVYWASVFSLPKIVIKDIDKILKGYLWCNGELSKGKSKSCLETFSMKDSLWVKWINVIRLKGRSIWNVKYDVNASCGWKQILALRDRRRKHIRFKVGDGKSIFMWHDKWWGDVVMSDIIPNEAIQRANVNDKIKLKDMVVNGKWEWPNEWDSAFLQILLISMPEMKEGYKDSAVWMTNDAILGRLTTQDKLLKWYPEKQVKCALCDLCPDSLDRLFFECNYSSTVWNCMKGRIKQPNMPDKWELIMQKMVELPNNRSIMSILKRIVVAACIYYIWGERNRMLFTNEKRGNGALTVEITNYVRLKLTSLTVKDTKQVRDVNEIWQVKMNQREEKENILSNWSDGIYINVKSADAFVFVEDYICKKQMAYTLGLKVQVMTCWKLFCEDGICKLLTVWLPVRGYMVECQLDDAYTIFVMAGCLQDGNVVKNDFSPWLPSAKLLFRLEEG
ncbi:RNA-directed DNA polymerase, eukaryota, reverse transcriptase zinc-binding domain protein [Tanacetum coccineum]